jgi:hypothetical protein
MLRAKKALFRAAEVKKSPCQAPKSKESLRVARHATLMGPGPRKDHRGVDLISDAIKR